MTHTTSGPPVVHVASLSTKQTEGIFFGGGGGAGGRRAEGNWCIEMGQNVSSPAGLCCVLAF